MNSVDEIIHLKVVAGRLKQAVEDFERDINCNPFDIQDAQTYFEEVAEHFKEAQEMLEALATDDDTSDDD